MKLSFISLFLSDLFSYLPALFLTTCIGVISYDKYFEQFLIYIGIVTLFCIIISGYRAYKLIKWSKLNHFSIVKIGRFKLELNINSILILAYIGFTYYISISEEIRITDLVITVTGILLGVYSYFFNYHQFMFYNETTLGFDVNYPKTYGYSDIKNYQLNKGYLKLNFINDIGFAEIKLKEYTNLKVIDSSEIKNNRFIDYLKNSHVEYIKPAQTD